MTRYILTEVPSGWNPMLSAWLRSEQNHTNRPKQRRAQKSLHCARLGVRNPPTHNTSVDDNKCDPSYVFNILYANARSLLTEFGPALQSSHIQQARALTDNCNGNNIILGGLTDIANCTLLGTSKLALRDAAPNIISTMWSVLTATIQ